MNSITGVVEPSVWTNIVIVDDNESSQNSKMLSLMIEPNDKVVDYDKNVRIGSEGDETYGYTLRPSRSDNLRDHDLLVLNENDRPANTQGNIIL